MRIFKYRDRTFESKSIAFNEERACELQTLEEEYDTWNTYVKQKTNGFSFIKKSSLKNQTYFYFLFEVLYKEDYS